MGLLVGKHLHPVLQVAQAAVGVTKLVTSRIRNVPGCGQGVEGVEGAKASQPRVTTPEDQLLCLDIELDLADAAPAELEVGTPGRQAIIDLVDVDLALDGVDVGYGREVQVPAPDEGLQLDQESVRSGDVAGAGPGLDEGRPLPVLANALVVVEGGDGRDRWRR